jgi:hypothetical protein
VSLNVSGTVSSLVLVAASVAGPASAEPLDKPTLYRLEHATTFERGCFNPCDCPSGERVPVTGTFRLALVAVGNVFDFYEVTGVRWKVHRSNGEVVEITGSGTYAVSSVTDQQRLDLTLTVGTDPPTIYRSDDLPGGSAFPRIALQISINGGVCFDTVIDLKAKPARRLYVEPGEVWWDVESGLTNATSDVVMGDLRMLRQNTGAFNLATWSCAADSNAAGATPFANDPSPGQSFWFLERATGDVYEDADAAQVAPPDPGIAQSPGACP